MAANKRVWVGVIGIALVGVYSAIMMASNGAAASWAWLILAAAIGAIILAARMEKADSSGEPE
ncbi:MAG: hypothetical protein GY722_12500 [bacterium]|nr:hypothetical protein [bacterium]